MESVLLDIGGPFDVISWCGHVTCPFSGPCEERLMSSPRMSVSSGNSMQSQELFAPCLPTIPPKRKMVPKKEVKEFFGEDRCDACKKAGLKTCTSDVDRSSLCWYCRQARHAECSIYGAFLLLSGSELIDDDDVEEYKVKRDVNRIRDVTPGSNLAMLEKKRSAGREASSRILKSMAREEKSKNSHLISDSDEEVEEDKWLGEQAVIRMATKVGSCCLMNGGVLTDFVTCSSMKWSARRSVYRRISIT